MKTKEALKKNTLTVFDVGASGGIHSRWSNSNLDVRSILFEPDTEAFEKLGN